VHVGDKSLAVGIINMPGGIKKTITLFFGCDSVEIVCAKELNISGIVGYDIFDLLVNFWNVRINNPKELANSLKNLNQ
jgi:site-specific DNA-adenine methylase